MKTKIILEKLINYKNEIILGTILFIIYFYFRKKNDPFFSNLKSNDLFENTYYINLEHRKDRNINTINELQKIGIYNPNRYNANKYDKPTRIRSAKGAIGCQMSHLNILKMAKENNWDYVTIFEDDIVFLKPKETLQKLNNILKSNIDWDVILLGGNNFKPYTVINDDCVKVNNCQVRCAYIVKRSYYDKLINIWDWSLKKLIETNHRPLYSGDQSWKILQKQDTFLLITPMNVIQREDYSDIEEKKVDYKNHMLNHKINFFY